MDDPAQLLARQLDVAARLRATVEVAGRLGLLDTPEQIARSVAEALVDDLLFDAAEVWPVQADGTLRLAALAGDHRGTGRVVGDSVAVDHGPTLVADVARSGMPVLLNDLDGPYGAVAVHPLLVDADLWGVLVALSRRPIPVETADVLDAFVTVVTAACAGARLRQAGDERLRSLVSGLGAVVWEADPATAAFRFVNDRAEALLGCPPAQWTAEADFWERHVHPDDRAWVGDHRRAAVEGGRDYDLEYRMVGADGRLVWVRDIVTVTAGADGRPERVFGVTVDATGRKHAEEALRESRARFAAVARTLQESLLPPHLPEIFGMEVAARYRPADHGLEVVGDFYDLFEVGDDGWGVVIGDVCGKGAEAATLTALARYTVRAAAIRERQPSRILDVLNNAVLTADTGERFCTAAFALLVPDVDGMACTVSCGGHPQPLVLRADGAVETVGGLGTLLGCWPEPELVDEGTTLGAGDALVLFTDGALEARHGGEQLGEERLRELVGRCVGLRADDIAEAVAQGVAAFEAGTAGDDLAVVVLRVPG
jgi:sigma-B regulation protein RsbU (phosphoserine phosphatase)